MEENSNSAEEGAVGYDTSLQPQPSTSLSRQLNDNIYEPICLDPNASSDDIAEEENIYETIEEVRLRQQHALNHQPPMEEPIYLDQLSCSSTYGRIGKSVFILSNIKWYCSEFMLFNAKFHLQTSSVTVTDQIAFGNKINL